MLVDVLHSSNNDSLPPPPPVGCVVTGWCLCVQSLEAQRLEQLAREREKAQEVVAKAQQESLKFSKATKEKLRRSMELNKENREAQIKALQERLREHVGLPCLALVPVECVPCWSAVWSASFCTVLVLQSVLWRKDGVVAFCPVLYTYFVAVSALCNFVIVYVMVSGLG